MQIVLPDDQSIFAQPSKLEDSVWRWEFLKSAVLLNIGNACGITTLKTLNVARLHTFSALINKLGLVRKRDRFGAD
jgi:hypothetical protein